MLQKSLITISLALLSFLPVYGQGEAELVTSTEVFYKAKVLRILDSGTLTIANTETSAPTQTLETAILSGEKEGDIVTFANDYIQLEEGQVFYLRHVYEPFDDMEYWSVADPYRLNVLWVLIGAFVLLTFIFGGIQGVRGLASLLGSMVLIFYVLVPNVYAGHNAILVSLGVASLIIILGSYITHGFTRTTSAAVIGMLVTVGITGIAAYFAVHMARLSGFSVEEATYLTINTGGAINMVGLLFGGIMIGLLGVLYDMAIGQAVAIEELFRAGKHMTRLEVYTRGIRIGREHIGALVNTLAIAYVGASLPLLLLIQSSEQSIGLILNSEIFATEIIRIIIGSIGLILAVPITTLIASYMLWGRVGSIPSHTHHTHSQ